MPGVPLALGRRHEASLTMQPETHWSTQFGGVRKDYMDAAHEWHKACAKTGNWYMPFAPKERPFPVPELIDRAVLELGDHVWPHVRGKQSVGSQLSDKQRDEQNAGQESSTVLLCGHAASDKQFGAERSLLNVAKAIAGLGHKLIVTLPERNMAYLEELKPYCSDIVLMPSPWRQDDEVWPISLDAYQRLIKHFGVDLVHVNTLVNRVPLLAAWELGVPSALHVRELLNWDPALIAAMGDEDADTQVLNPLMLADRLIANSDYTAQCLLSQHPELVDKLAVVTNTVSMEGDWQAVNTNKQTLRIGMVSSNLPKKGLDDFVAIAKAGLAAKINTEFVLIGPVNEHTEVLQANMPANINMAGYANSPEEAMAQLDVLVNLSQFQESFGRTVAEAMLAAKPVIAYRWGALPELVTNGETGFLVHLGDTQGVLQRLELLCRQPEMMAGMGVKAQQIAKARFNDARFQTDLGKAYQDLLPPSLKTTCAEQL
nr:glycosyltransferase family 4 protein [Shewanella sp. NIFS-20-20]